MAGTPQPNAANEAGSVQDKLGAIRLIAMDIDGVLTDGAVELVLDGPEVKRFNVADGLGLRLVMNTGIQVAWISGRASEIVQKRAAELGITHLYEKTPNKSIPLAELMGRFTLSTANIAYMGDDLNDLPAFSLAGAKFAPANAATEIKALADFVTTHAGGAGAVREMCDVILKAQGRFNDALTIYLAGLLKTEVKAEEAG
jgi:3-deoxy-D-manno-octulosonate 8-phosphate phosphatase (KDO 8-P phosphatase)